MTLVYVPGLGDDSTIKKQLDYLQWWGKRHKVTISFFIPKWHEDESYQTKWSRLNDQVNKISDSNIVVVGVSAGASLAVRIMAEHPQIRFSHVVCGKLLHADAIGQPFRDRAPALYDSVKYTEGLISNRSSLFASKVTCYRPIFDPVVPIADAAFRGANNKRIPLIGHNTSIIWYLLRFLPRRV